MMGFMKKVKTNLKILSFFMVCAMLFSAAGCFDDGKESSNAAENVSADTGSSDSASDSQQVTYYDAVITKSSVLNHTLNVGHQEKVSITINSRETGQISDLPVNIYLVETVPGDSDPKQISAGTYTIPTVFPGEFEYFVQVNLPAEQGYSGNYQIIAHIAQDNVEDLLEVDASGNTKAVTDETPDPERDMLRTNLESDLANSRVNINLSASYLFKPDVILNNINTASDVYVLFANGLGNTEDPQKISGRLEIMTLANDLNAADVTFKIITADGQVNQSILVWDNDTQTFKDKVSFASLRASDRIGFQYDLKLTDDAIAAMKNYVKLGFLDSYPFIITATITSAEEDTIFADNNTVTTEISIVPDESIIVPTGSNLVIERTWDRMFDSKFIGVGLELGSNLTVNTETKLANGTTVIDESFHAWADVPAQIIGRDFDFMEMNLLLSSRHTGDRVGNSNVFTRLGGDSGDNNYFKVEVCGMQVYKKTLVSDSTWRDGIDDDWAINMFNTHIAELDGIPKAFVLEKRLSYGQEFAIGPVPCYVEIGVFGQIGYTTYIVTGTSMKAGVVPFATMGAYAVGAVGCSWAWVGVRATLYLATIQARAICYLNLNLITDPVRNKLYLFTEGGYGLDISLIGPYGKIDLVAEYPWIKWCKKWGVPYPCGITTKTSVKNLASFGPAFIFTQDLYRDVVLEQKFFLKDLQ